MAQQTKTEPDAVYILKIVVFFILGGIWVAFDRSAELSKVLPVGLIVGIIIASHDHFQIDRKIEYAVLLASAALSYVAPLGLVFLI